MDDRKGPRPLDILNNFPLLLIPVLIYNLMALFSAAPPPDQNQPALAAALRGEAFLLPMFSGADLALTWGDMLLLLAVIFLLVEVIKSTRRGTVSLVHLILTAAAFLLCAIEFLTSPRFASSTFFLLTMIVLLQALTGFSQWLVARRATAATRAD